MERIHDIEIRVTLVESAMVGEGYEARMTPIDWLEDMADMGEPELKISTKILKTPRAELKLRFTEDFVAQELDKGVFIDALLSTIKEKLVGALK